MGDTPRSAKRRKVENGSSPQTRGTATPQIPATDGSLKRLTRRKPSHSGNTPQHNSVEPSNGVEYSVSIDKRQVLGALNGSSRKRPLEDFEDEVSLYDDIEGAHAEDTPSRSLRARIWNRIRAPFHDGKESLMEGSKATNGTPSDHNSPRVSRHGPSGTLPGADREDVDVDVENASTLATATTMEANREGSCTELSGARGNIKARSRGPPKKTENGETRKSSRPSPAAQSTHARASSHLGASSTPNPRNARDMATHPNSDLQERNRRRSRRLGNRADHLDGDYCLHELNGDHLAPPTKGEEDEGQTTGTKRPSGAKDADANVVIPQSRLRGMRNRPDHTDHRMDISPDELQRATSEIVQDGIEYPDADQMDVDEDCPQTADTELVAFPSIDRSGSAHGSPGQARLKPDSGRATFADPPALLKNIVLEKLTGKRAVPLVGLDDEYGKVHQLVEQTVVAGEGNSMLLIGARGSGKSALVERVIKEVSRDHGEDFHIIKLNGFIHTDDKLALREIWRQLGKEMEIEDDSIGKNYADTLSTLLALLSHPAELTGEDSGHVAKAVVFVMDEFDLFASHPRQTLLYNLFDIAQSRKAPIAVLGLTTRIDVMESLEKRVKSRFSHRYVHLSLPKSFNSFQEICKSALMVQKDELNVQERALLSGPVPLASKNKKSPKSRPPPELLKTWNTHVTRLFSSTTFRSNYLAPAYHRTKSLPAVLSSLIFPMSNVPAADFPTLSTDAFLALGPFHPPDSILAILPSLSTLQLSLVIAAARLPILTDADSCNFNMAYAEYVSLASKARIQSAAGGQLAVGAGTKVWGKEAARREWERLVDWGLLVPALVGDHLVRGTTMVRCDVALEEIAPSVPGMDRMLERWCRVL